MASPPLLINVHPMNKWKCLSCNLTSFLLSRNIFCSFFFCLFRLPLFASFDVWLQIAASVCSFETPMPFIFCTFSCFWRRYLPFCEKKKFFERCDYWICREKGCCTINVEASFPGPQNHWCICERVRTKNASLFFLHFRYDEKERSEKMTKAVRPPRHTDKGALFVISIAQSELHFICWRKLICFRLQSRQQLKWSFKFS